MIKTIRRRVFAGFIATPLVLASTALHAQTFSALYNYNNYSGGSTDPNGFVFPGALAQGLDGNVYTTLNRFDEAKATCISYQ